MFNDSTSPQIEYNSLLQWRNLPETQEVLKYLRDKVEATDRMVHRSPIGYRSVVDNREVPMEAGLVQQLRDQFVGEWRGLREFERKLDERQAELEEKLKQQEKK